MSERNLREQEPVKSEKEILWDKNLQELDETSDALGYRIETGIKEAVNAFNLMGLPTSGSCEGHIDRALSFPWVDVSSPNEPEERYVEQNETFKKVAKERGLPEENVKRGLDMDAYWEAMKQMSEETKEYKKWDLENKKLAIRAQELLNEFYENKKDRLDNKLGVYGGVGGFRIHGVTEAEYRRAYEESGDEISEERKAERAGKLPVYRKEMDDFTQFLKDKFFAE